MASTSAGAAPPPSLIPVSAATATTSARSDTFKTEFHPHSGHPTTVETFSAYGTGLGTRSPMVDDTPWHPFTCCADFEFTELAHKAALNKDQMNELLKFIWQVADGHTKFSFRTHRDVTTAWARASSQMSPFEKHIIPIDYKKETIEYEVYSRPLWDWAMDLLANPLLAPHFVWDAQQLYKHDGTHFEHCFHEPWMGDHWWNLQSLLPENGVPFAFILYADKTHLSSAGTVKAYPVITRCGNLPVNIRNVNGPGGGCLVGWCVMALIRGLNSACPCPICLAPREELTDHSTTYPKRTIKDAQDRVKLWSRDCIVGEAELKKQNLRPIKNALWKVKLSNPHDALSQDPLHLYHKGKFGNHLFDEFKKHVKALGHAAEKKVDKQFDAFPQWQNLNHFNRITNIYFTDGNKFQDISREYIEALGDDTTKNWNFPKAHASKHVFTDIREKGAARNFSTRPNEKQHGLIKCAYKLQTNRKDIANQTRSYDPYLDDQPFGRHIHLGAPQHSLTLSQLEEENASKPAFAQFRKKLSLFLNNFLPTYNILLPDGKIKFSLGTISCVQEHRFLKVNYESAVDWKLTTDYLRCNPSFHEHE
ncbi:uncharacterized protein EDB91DRAFT_1239125 [Suillus paluster]|uniref:uncharacterized protein n=1 Tax=Suillus paluster TaxID=48578 RepID=UPI001B8872F4|nr:uncharacterized protein EDB91DRAFT_1239125 [Suillus paluster]KAG1730266.1 hypothetical protein EDB91DRAFT_1239125 [Suillus paluster]